MKLVIDTNIFVSSFFGGSPRRVIDLWKEGKVTLCLSSKILDEYISVLRRIGLEDEKELAELLDVLSKGINILFTRKTPELHLIREDPDDDKFIECAVELRADYIVTGDKALLDFKEYMGIQILTAREFLNFVCK